MSRNFEWEDFNFITVKDYLGLKKYLDEKKLRKNDPEYIEDEEEESCKELVHLDYQAKPEENKIEWTFRFGIKWEKKDKELDTYINHADPETMSDFLDKVSKFLEDYDIIVTDEEFPTIDTQNAYAWHIINTNGRVTINELFLKEGKKIHDSKKKVVGDDL